MEAGFCAGQPWLGMGAKVRRSRQGKFWVEQETGTILRTCLLPLGQYAIQASPIHKAGVWWIEREIEVETKRTL